LTVSNKLYSLFYSLFGAVGADNAAVFSAVDGYRPGIQSDNWNAALEGIGDFRERAVAAVDSDNSLGGFYYCRVPGVTDTGSDWYLYIRVGGLAVITG